jgi:FkbM family methyltransferase
MREVKNAVKVAACSRSIRFTRDFLRQTPDGSTSTYTWQGNVLHFRPGTSDTGLVNNILLKGTRSEYAPPKEFRVDYKRIRTVLDVGANIGLSALYFATIFPNAAVHAFEPAIDNLTLLRKNTKAIGRIHCHAFGLGDRDAELALFRSDDANNFGGFSLHDHTGTDSGKAQLITVRRTDAALRELGLNAVDVIKVDTEGSEWEILTSMAAPTLAGTKLIMGELHGRRDFALLDFLQPLFHIGLKKGVRNRLFNFYAIRRD